MSRPPPPPGRPEPFIALRTACTRPAKIWPFDCQSPQRCWSTTFPRARARPRHRDSGQSVVSSDIRQWASVARRSLRSGAALAARPCACALAQHGCCPRSTRHHLRAHAVFHTRASARMFALAARPERLRQREAHFFRAPRRQRSAHTCGQRPYRHRDRWLNMRRARLPSTPNFRKAEARCSACGARRCILRRRM